MSYKKPNYGDIRHSYLHGVDEYYNGRCWRNCVITNSDGTEDEITGLRIKQPFDNPVPRSMKKSNFNVKQVIILRKDLGMRKGKMVAQGAHASLGAAFSESYVELAGVGPCDKKIIPLRPDLEEWFNSGFAKITVYVNSLEDLMHLHEQAKDANLMHCLIEDQGHTEFNGVPTYTALAIGPAPSEELDKITGHLKLL